jgi:glycosyltransferase involved in cell wall biosynthesis
MEHGGDLDVTVIVPTRNEAANVRPLVSRVRASLEPTGIAWEILFVDDSDDETVPAIAAIAEHDQRIRIHHRAAEQRLGGLAGAVVEGFERSSGRVLAVMDGDLQHPPEVLPALVSPLFDERADLVIATRYAAGGSAAGLEGGARATVSRMARALTRLAFPRARAVSDPLGGYFAVPRAAVEGVDLHPEGFKILLEVLVRGRWSRVAEVPYEFSARHGGMSKATFKEGKRFIRHVLRLYRTRPRQTRETSPDTRGRP